MERRWIESKLTRTALQKIFSVFENACQDMRSCSTYVSDIYFQGKAKSSSVQSFFHLSSTRIDMSYLIYSVFLHYLSIHPSIHP